MKRCCFLLFILITSVLSRAQNNTIVLEGKYQGKNLYIQNSASAEGYCTEKVVVNGKEITFSNTSAFEIKLDSMGFKISDSVKVEIFHKNDCLPKVLNPYSGNPKTTFEIVSISIDFNSILHWTCQNEVGKFTYIVEQYCWNKWIKVGEVQGKQASLENTYSFQTATNSGKNQFRVKQKFPDGTNNISKVVDFTVPDLNIKILNDQNKLANELEFNRETMYELYDKNGIIIRRGRGKKIDLKGLDRGYYYLNYDNKITDVNKFW